MAFAGAPVVYLSGGVPTRAAAEAFVPRWRWERELFFNQTWLFDETFIFVHESNNGPPRSVLYNAVLATHRLFPFRDYGLWLSGPKVPLSQEPRHLCGGRSLRSRDPPH